MVVDSWLELAFSSPEDSQAMLSGVVALRDTWNTLLNLKVDVGLPQDLGHVQLGLVDGQLEDGSDAVDVAEDGLQLCVLDPRGAVLGAELQQLLVENPASIELAKLNFQVDVTAKQLGLRTFPDGCA